MVVRQADSVRSTRLSDWRAFSTVVARKSEPLAARRHTSLFHGEDGRRQRNWGFAKGPGDRRSEI